MSCGWPSSLHFRMVVLTCGMVVKEEFVAVLMVSDWMPVLVARRHLAAQFFHRTGTQLTEATFCPLKAFHKADLDQIVIVVDVL